MPVTIKTSAMKYKNPDTGQYEGVDMIEEQAVRDIVADDYSPTSPYAVGAYCLYNGDYYRCTTAIQSGEAWNASHWTPTQVSDELVSIKGAVNSIGTNEVANESNVSGVTASAALNTLNGAITSKLFTKTVTFSASAITSANPISDSNFTADTRLVSYQFIDSNNQETGDILADISTSTSAGSCTVTLIRGHYAGSVILLFGNPT